MQSLTDQQTGNNYNNRSLSQESFKVQTYSDSGIHKNASAQKWLSEEARKLRQIELKIQ